MTSILSNFEDKVPLKLIAKHTQEELLRYFTYDKETGILYWKINKRKARIGDKVGSMNKAGYLTVTIDNTCYYVHRIIWCILYGEFPNKWIDHENTNRTINTPKNLRIATGSGNACNRGISRNNTSGVKGICWRKTNKQWFSRIEYNKKKLVNFLIIRMMLLNG